MANYMAKNRSSKKNKPKTYSGYELGDVVLLGLKKGRIVSSNEKSETSQCFKDNPQEFLIYTVDFNDGDTAHFNSKGNYTGESNSSDAVDFWKEVGIKLTVIERFKKVKVGKYYLTPKTSIKVTEMANDNELNVAFNDDLEVQCVTKEEFHKAFPDASFIK